MPRVPPDRRPPTCPPPMPVVHDWTRVDAGMFHAFHTAWLGALQGALNRGVMPPGYSAAIEQYAGPGNVDVVTLAADDSPAPGDWGGGPSGGVATLAEAPPRVAQTRVCVPPEVDAFPRRSLVVRRRAGRRPVGVIEIVSAGNKSSVAEIERFVGKVVSAVRHGLHVLVADLHPPAARDPDGIHGLIGEELGDGYVLDADKPLTFVSYLADDPTVVYLDPRAVGDPVPDMPLFLDPGHYVNVPLAATYADTFGGFPPEEREILEA